MPVIQYVFLEYCYYGNTRVYESILLECLNKSEKMKQIAGGTFRSIASQAHGECDVCTNEYSLDFKLLISPSLAEFQSLASPKVCEIASGVYAHINGKKIEQRVVLLLNACRNITPELLNIYRSQKERLSKDVVRLFDQTLSRNKNLFIFLPAYLSAVNQSLDYDQQFEAIRQDLSESLEGMFRFREKQHSRNDTYLAYIANIPEKQDFSVVILRWNGFELEEIDRVFWFSLPSVREIAERNMIFSTSQRRRTKG